MGLYANALIKILKIIQWEGVKNKTLCMLGKQAILVDLYELKRMLDIFHIPYCKEKFNEMSKAGMVDSYLFFKMIGFKEVHALDYSPYEGADLIFDLNTEISEEIQYKFDFVIDGGVTEHVYNTAKAMENMSKLLRVGGIIIHILPSTGLVNHGFYSFSPAFFLDFYEKNKFNILDLELEFLMDCYKDNVNYYGMQTITSVDLRLFDNDPDDWEKCNINKYISKIQRLDEVQHSYIWCIVKKRVNTSIQIPIQGIYQKAYTSIEEGTVAISHEFNEIALESKGL